MFSALSPVGKTTSRRAFLFLGVNLMESLSEGTKSLTKGACNSSTLLVKKVQSWAFDDTLVRTVQLENDTWFAGKDVAVALDSPKAWNLIQSLDSDETDS